MNLKLIITRLDSRAKLPSYAHEGDAGLDLCSLKNYSIAPFKRMLIQTGLALQIPEGYAGFVLPRSGLSIREGLTLINTPGLIDSGYRGEVCIAAVNLDPENTVEINAGDRIAQLVLMQTPHVELVEDALSESERGEKGFGSSGLQ